MGTPRFPCNRARLRSAAPGKREFAVSTRTTTAMSATHARNQLETLLDELRAARRSPLAGNATYMADLDAEIAACRATYVAAAVTELALLRGAVLGRNQG